MNPTTPICAAADCDNPLDRMRADARYCSTACRMRAHRKRSRLAHPHPYRDTPQYKQMRDVLAEHPGRHWVEQMCADDEDDDELEAPGGWDRYLRQTGQEYGTAGWD